MNKNIQVNCKDFVQDEINYSHGLKLVVETLNTIYLYHSTLKCIS